MTSSESWRRYDKLVRNEQIKLFASALDRASTTCITVGIATPVAGYIDSVSGFRNAIAPLTMVYSFGRRLFVAASLHLIASRLLRRLKR